MMDVVSLPEEQSKSLRPMPTHDVPSLQRPYDSSLEPDTLSSDSEDSLRAQLHSVNYCLDEVQR